jgi:uncharacterized membrane protein
VDLNWYGFYPVNPFSGAWRVYGRIPPILFLLVVGISLWLAFARSRSRGPATDRWAKYLVRGAKILGWGVVLSLVTWVFMGRLVIVSGILHLIGISIIIAYPFLRLSWPNLLIGIGLIVVGAFFNSIPVQEPWLLWLGFMPRNLYQADYFPLLPWFGLIPIGIFLGQRLYPAGERGFTLPDLQDCALRVFLVWLGRRSLFIYLIHQPILLALFALLQKTA